MAQRNLFKRAKMGQLPGDLAVRTKAKMLEQKPQYPKRHKVVPGVPSPLNPKCARGFKKDQIARAKIQDKRRGQREIEDGLHD